MTATSQPAAAASASPADTSATWIARRVRQGAAGGVGEVGRFELHGGAAGRDGSRDLLEGGRARHAAEPEPGDLVDGRAVSGETRHAAGNRDHEACRACPAAGGVTG